MHQICDFKGENWRAGLRRLKFLSLRDHNICQKNDQNSVFLSEALYGEIIIWNNQIFEEGYLSHPKYLGPNVWFNIQLVPKSFSKYYWILLWLWLFMTQVVKYTMKVKVIKYFLQIFDIWNNGAGKKWGVRYTFWYMVLLTLCNGDRRIVQWRCEACSPMVEVGNWFFLNLKSFHSLLSSCVDLTGRLTIRWAIVWEGNSDRRWKIP